MTCQHPGCSFTIFTLCTNHCMKNVCLEHLIEHGDTMLNDYTNLVDHIDKSTCILMNEVNSAATQIIQRRQYEIARINRLYDEEQQEIQKRLTFAENADALIKAKQQQLTKSKQKNECYIAQHDFEQIKSYAIQLKTSTIKKPTKEEEEEPMTISYDMINNSNLPRANSSTTYSCPLMHPNVFGIKPEHNLRFDCNGPKVPKYSLTKHLEYYHRMLPECASRLKDAIINGQSPTKTKLFSDNEIIFNKDYFVDCPLTDPTNVYGARSSLSSLVHIPCTKKQITVPSLFNHFHLYHKMKFDVTKKMVNAMKTKSLHSDLILFGEDERIGTSFMKK